MSQKIIKGTTLEKGWERRGGSAVSFAPEGGVVRKSEILAQDKAQKIIEEALVEARKIKEEAGQIRAQIEKEREEAKKGGYEEGKRKGLEEFTDALLKVKEAKERFFADAESQIIQLVLDISEKVIGQLALEHVKVLRMIVNQALEKALGDRIVVRAHPDDLKRFKEEEKELREKMDKTKHLHFKEDETIRRGGCVIETEIGTIDAQLDTQLKAIKKAFGL